MADKILSISRRTRCTPFSDRVEAAGVKAYTVYNHMLLPTVFRDIQEDYDHLCNHVQVWDVGCERQVEVRGTDAAKLVQLMTPRDLSQQEDLQGKYAPICDEHGRLLNDPIIIKLNQDRWWISIADSDVKFFAKGLASGMHLDVEVFEPDVWPLAVQGPKSDDLMARVFGEEVRSIRFFRGLMFNYHGTELYIARSGWSKQGGFEIYVSNPDIAEPLWDELFTKGADLNVGPGCPNLIERIESGLMSFGNDIDETNNPFECGLDSYLDLSAEIENLSLPALRAMANSQTKLLMGITCDQELGNFDPVLSANGNFVGEVTSHCWSKKYQKHLLFAMMQRDYLEFNSTVVIGTIEGKIHALPFSQEALTAS